VRHAAGAAVIDGEQIALGEQEYAPVCGKHYLELVGDGLARMGWRPLE
jgi:thymidine kinase